MTSESRKWEIQKCKSLEYVWTISLIQANIVMSTNMNSMVHINQKHKIDTQNLEWKEHRYITQENQETTREETKITRKESSLNNGGAHCLTVLLSPCPIPHQ